MELKEIIKIIKKEFKIILGVAIIFLIGGLIFSLLKKPYYEVNFSLLISQTTTQETENFKYDAYYGIGAADKIGDFILAQIKSPEVVALILKEAQLPDFDKIKNSRTLIRFFKAYKGSTQSIGIRFALPEKENAQVIIEKANAKINENWQRTYNPKEGDAQYQIKNTQPLIVYRKTNIFFNIASGFILGIVVGIFLLLFKVYLESDN